MKNVFLGEYVKQRRLDLGLTQEQLCDGICEPMTLSRLENGKQTPSRNRINALLQRLGLPDDRYFALLSKNELEMEALQKEIVACNVTEKVPEGFEKLAQFEKLADPDDQIAQQFALRSRVLPFVLFEEIYHQSSLHQRYLSHNRQYGVKLYDAIRS